MKKIMFLNELKEMNRLKKLALVTALVGAFVLMSGVGALAAETPHGPFNANTATCAACHRAHTASAEYLLAAPKATGLCLQCHGNGATGADTNVYNGAYVVDGTETRWLPAASGYDHATWGLATKPLLGGGFLNVKNAGVDHAATSMHMDPTNNAALTAFQIQFGGNSVAAAPGMAKSYLDCVDCHMPHNSPNYRMLRMKPTGTTAADLFVPSKALVSSASGLTAALTTPAGNRTLVGKLLVKAGSVLVNGTSVAVGSKVNNATDRTAFAGSAYNKVWIATTAGTSAGNTLQGDVVFNPGSVIVAGSTLAIGTQSTDLAGDVAFYSTGTWAAAYATTNAGRRYTEDTGLFNTIVNEETVGANESVSKWCGLGCHDFYYRSAIRSDNALVSMGTRLNASYNIPLPGGGPTNAIITVKDATGISATTKVVINGVSYNLMAAPSGNDLTLSGPLWYGPGVAPSAGNVVTVGTPVSISGQGMELYYDLDSNGSADSNFMHAIDVDLNYTPRNGNGGNQPLAPNLSATGNALGALTMPVADESGAGSFANSGNVRMTCLTCHRAHGTDATMNQDDAKIGTVTTTNANISTTSTSVVVAAATASMNGMKIGFLNASSKKAYDGVAYTVTYVDATHITVAPAINATVANPLASGSIITSRIINNKVFPSAANSMLLRLENRAVCQQCHMMPSGF